MSTRKANIALMSLFTGFLFTGSIHGQDYCCDPCGGVNRFWIGLDYLYWNFKDSPDPTPFIVTAPITSNHAPLIGVPGTEVVLGEKNIRNDWRSGGRFSLGFWLDDACDFGLEASYLFLPKGSRSQIVATDGLPGTSYLSVPFFDVTTGTESSSPVAVPGLYRGAASLQITNSMQSAELNLLGGLFSQCSSSVGYLIGFRYWNFNEKLNFFVDSPAIAIPDEIFLVKDRFHTENNFYGGQLGLVWDYSYNQFFLNVKGKLALGAMCEDVNIEGDFITNAFDGFGAPEVYYGGYFGLPTNIGKHKKTCFAVIPEVDLNIGYQVMDCLRIQVGYSFIYVDKVLWAGDQVNRDINPTQSALYEFTPTPVLVGAPLPDVHLKSKSFWAQGISVGIELQF